MQEQKSKGKRDEDEMMSVVGSINMRNIKGGQLNISSGDFVGHDQTEFEGLSSLQRDIIHQVETLLEKIETEREQLPWEVAEEVNDELRNVLTLLSIPGPNKWRLLRRLHNVADILEQAGGDVGQQLMPSLKTAIEMIETRFE